METDELESFKTDINLTEFAAASGYRLDRKASSRNSVVMTHPERDKIIIAVGSARAAFVGNMAGLINKTAASIFSGLSGGGRPGRRFP
jgi:hypothetical protein